MLEIFTVTADNIKEVAKATGQRFEDLKSRFEENTAAGKKTKIYVEQHNIPEGFMRSNR
jgi:hypothetical protein